MFDFSRACFSPHLGFVLDLGLSSAKETNASVFNSLSFSFFFFLNYNHLIHGAKAGFGQLCICMLKTATTIDGSVVNIAQDVHSDEIACGKVH